MDLGLNGRKAIVCASSRGLGFACAYSLGREGVDLVINGRNSDSLAAAAADLRSQLEIEVECVAGDIADPAVRQLLFDACPEPDILVNNNGGPPPGRFASWEHDDWTSALEANMLAPLAMIRGVLEGMTNRGFGRIVNITSAMVKTPVSAMGLSTGARAGLTSVSKSLSRDVARHNVTINNILPERIDTARQQQMAKRHSERAGITVEEAYDHMRSTIAARRLGRPEEVGDACAFLCSAQAGYITGQNLQLDGGSYEGLF